MQILRAKQRHPGPVRLPPHLPSHPQFRGQWRKCGSKSRNIEDLRWAGTIAPRAGWSLGRTVERPFHAHKKQAQVMILVLVRVQNICAPLVKQRGNSRHQPLLVRAINQQDSRILHIP
jgi:hypothetical protein